MLQGTSIEIFTYVDCLLPFAFKLPLSLQGERIEDVARIHAEHGEVHGKGVIVAVGCLELPKV
jgi:hypothetical protein